MNDNSATDNTAENNNDINEQNLQLKKHKQLLKNMEKQKQVSLQNAQIRQNNEKINIDKQIEKHQTEQKKEQKKQIHIVAVGIVISIIFVTLILPTIMSAIPSSNTNEDSEMVTPTEDVTLGWFTVTDSRNPSKSASFADGQTGIIYSNTLSFPYGSPYYVLSITNAVPPVTITASNMVPSSNQASFDVTVKDSSENTVGNIEFGSGDKRSKKIMIRSPGDYTVIMEGQYIKSVNIDIEKT